MRKNIHLDFFLLFLFIPVLSCKTDRHPGKADESDSALFYREEYRPQYHFSQASGWMNDPNGMFYLDGEYNLFYQYYPDSTVWGPMHWGHAISTDLVHWTHLPAALYPDSLGYIFSGSAVVDTRNVSGLGSEANPAVLAFFTYHDPVLEKSGSNVFQNQGMAFSTDKGSTWIKYKANPVLKNPGIRDFRDPKVFWHEGSGKWIMILAVQDRVHLYSSPNLLSWTFESEFGKEAGAHGGVWECPDMFELKVQNSDASRWVMLVSINPGGPGGGSATQYFTGRFDGHRFISDHTGEKWLDMGRDNYAGVTWSNIPRSDGRCLFIGWMSNWDYANRVPTVNWRSSMTLPRELSLEKAGAEYLLVSKPVKELSSLAEETFSPLMGPTASVEREARIGTGSMNLMQCGIKIIFVLSDTAADSLGIRLANGLGEQIKIGYSKVLRKVYFDRSKSGM
nr:glycoside hydrolase family 32 protein [Bacteroidales bacterium]